MTPSLLTASWKMLFDVFSSPWTRAKTPSGFHSAVGGALAVCPCSARVVACWAYCCGRPRVLAVHVDGVVLVDDGVAVVVVVRRLAGDSRSKLSTVGQVAAVQAAPAAQPAAAQQPGWAVYQAGWKAVVVAEAGADGAGVRRSCSRGTSRPSSGPPRPRRRRSSGTGRSRSGSGCRRRRTASRRRPSRAARGAVPNAPPPPTTRP